MDRHDDKLTLYANMNTLQMTVDSAVDKRIDSAVVRWLTDPAQRVFLLAAMEAGQYRIAPPHIILIPKSGSNEMRKVYCNEPLDRIICTQIGHVYQEMYGNRVHPCCVSYQRGIGVGQVVKRISDYIAHHPNLKGAKAEVHCPEVLEMRNRNKEALLSKDALLEQLSEGGYSDRALTEIRDRYMDVLGFDPVWRYPFCHDAGLGAVLIPVKEGFLWLPYSVIDIADNELYETESATLLEVESCELLIEEMKRYVGPLTSVMMYVADELKGTEKQHTDGKCGGVCMECAHHKCGR